MRQLITIFLTLFTLSSCWTKGTDSKKSAYIKVMLVGDALTPNAYNKGLGAMYYSYFNLDTDSVFYLYPEIKDLDDNDLTVNYVPHAFRGQLQNPNLRDTLMQLIHSLEWRPSGSIKNIPSDVMYCGWEYYVEFPAGDTVKYYSVTSGVSDTLDRFIDFFRNLEYSSWKKRPANPSDVNIDNEVVAVMKLFGSYEKREIPYLFPVCDSGIDFTKLVGRWRKVGYDYHSTRNDRFNVFNLNADRTFVMQTYTQGKFEDYVKGTYSLDTNGRKIIYVSKDGHRMTHTLTQLTDSCLSAVQYVPGRTGSKIKLNRY